MAMKVDYLDELAKDLVKQYKTQDALFGESSRNCKDGFYKRP